MAVLQTQSTPPQHPPGLLDRAKDKQVATSSANVLIKQQTEHVKFKKGRIYWTNKRLFRFFDAKFVKFARVRDGVNCGG